MDWMRFLEQTPLPVALVLGGAWMLHKAAIWIARRVLEPLIGIWASLTGWKSS